MPNLSIPVQARAGFLAEEIHQGQIRKSSGLSYFDEHLAKVAKTVEFAGGSQEIIAAAFLHDSLEDQPDRDPEQRILEECGQEVLDLVRECTEIGPGGEDKAPWRDRKLAYLKHLSIVSAGALMISVSDKLQSARDDMLPGVKERGDEYYNIFRKAGNSLEERKASTIWFHQQLVVSFEKRWEALSLPPKGLRALIDEFSDIVEWLESH